MSDPLKHECGIAVVRLKKPLAYYQDRYGSALWGFNKLFLLMEKPFTNLICVGFVVDALVVTFRFVSHRL